VSELEELWLAADIDNDGDEDDNGSLKPKYVVEIEDTNEV
jgi:hypothetical protein